MPFPLRRLPLLASMNVIKNIDVVDFINFIRTSTKMRNLVKLSKVDIYLEVLADDIILFEKLSDPDRTKVVHLFLKPDSTRQPTNLPFEPFIRRKSMYIVEENLEGYRRLMDDFVDIFAVALVDFDMRSIPSDISVHYLEYAISLGLKLKKVQADISTDHSVDCSRKVLAACARATELSIRTHGYLSKEYSVLDSFREYKMDIFELDCCRWFTLDHLFALMNCSNVRIHGVQLDDTDFNSFLKQWMRKIWIMETLHVEIHSTHDRRLIDVETVMNGIPKKEIQPREFEVKRADGVKATVCCSGIKFSIDVVKINN